MVNFHVKRIFSNSLFFAQLFGDTLRQSVPSLAGAGTTKDENVGWISGA